MAATEPLYGTRPSTPSGTNLSMLLPGVLEVAVGRAFAHRADRAHAAVLLVRAALEQDDVAGRLLGAGEHAAHHHGRRAGRDRLRDVARVADAAVGDDRDAACLRAPRATLSIAVICGTPTPATMRVVQIEPGPMPTLTPSAPSSASARAAAPVAMLPPMTSMFGYFVLIARTFAEHVRAVAVRGVDDEDVDAGGGQQLGALVGVGADAERRRRRAACPARPSRRADARPPSGCP